MLTKEPIGNDIWGKLIYASLLFLAAFLFTSISLSAAHHILLIVPGFYLLYKSIKNKSLNFSTSAYLLIAIIIWSAISVFANWSNINNPVHNIVKLKYLIIGIVSIPAFRYFFETYADNKKVKILVNTIIISTTLASLSGLIAYKFGYNPLKMKPACHPTRTCGMYGMYMTYGYGIGLFLSLLTGMLFYFKDLKNLVSKKLLIGSLLINLLSFALSFARGAYIGYFLSLPFYFYRKNKKLFISIVIAVSVSGVLAIKFIPKVNSLVFERGRIASVMIRFSQYKAAWIAGKENPLFGLGYKNFEANSDLIKKKHNVEYSHFRGHGHSNFFEHLGSTGFVGLIFLILFHLFWIKETYTRNDIIGLITFPFVIHFTFSGQFQYTFGDGENLFLIMAIYAISQLPRIQTEENQAA
jgi:O-antigen ligase